MTTPIVPPVEQVPPVVVPPEERSVSYETHRRLLDQRKKDQEQLDVLTKEKEAREKSEMEAKGEFQKMLALEKEKGVILEAKLTAFEERMNYAKKVSAILKSAGGEIDEKFFGLLPVDKIVIDPTTGEVDPNSVAAASDILKKNYPEIVKPKAGAALPPGAPAGHGNGKIARADWLKLPHKEMLKWKSHQIA